jgi:putative transcriptional regulator
MEPKYTVSEGIKAGILSCIEFENGNKKVARKVNIKVKPVQKYTAEEVKVIRNKTNLTQQLFGLVMGVSVRTVEAWERGVNQPNGSASRMLEMIEANPAIANEFATVES